MVVLHNVNINNIHISPFHRLMMLFSDYVDDMMMPKFMIAAAGDEFFLPDDSHHFWGKLKGPKYMRYLYLSCSFNCNVYIFSGKLIIWNICNTTPMFIG